MYCGAPPTTKKGGRNGIHNTTQQRWCLPDAMLGTKGRRPPRRNTPISPTNHFDFLLLKMHIWWRILGLRFVREGGGTEGGGPRLIYGLWGRGTAVFYIRCGAVWEIMKSRRRCSFFLIVRITGGGTNAIIIIVITAVHICISSPLHVSQICMRNSFAAGGASRKIWQMWRRG